MCRRVCAKLCHLYIISCIFAEKLRTIKMADECVESLVPFQPLDAVIGHQGGICPRMEKEQVEGAGNLPDCPVCGKPMQRKKAGKSSDVEPYLGKPVFEFECKQCAHIEGHHKV